MTCQRHALARGANGLATMILTQTLRAGTQNIYTTQYMVAVATTVQWGPVHQPHHHVCAAGSDASELWSVAGGTLTHSWRR